MQVVEMFGKVNGQTIAIPFVVDDYLATTFISSGDTSDAGGYVVTQNISFDDLSDAVVASVNELIRRHGYDVRTIFKYCIAQPGYNTDMPTSLSKTINAFYEAGFEVVTSVITGESPSNVTINDLPAGILRYHDNYAWGYHTRYTESVQNTNIARFRPPYYEHAGVNNYNRVWQISIPVIPSSALVGNKIDFSKIDQSGGYTILHQVSFSATYISSNTTSLAVSFGASATVNSTATIDSLIELLGTPYVSLPDPYTPDVPGGGSSEPGGGDGTWDFSDDDIPLPTLPTISSLDSGFIAAYSPTLAQLNDLASYMWTPNFITNLVKLFGDSPMDVIMGLAIIPITPPTGAATHVKLGNLDSGVSMKPITQQFVTVDCGSITLPGIYDAFLDWEPFTKATLYLPYIGAVNLNTNDIMGKTVNVTYYIDVISGACNAMVSAGGSVLYTFNGQCAAQMPITGSDYRSMFQSAIQGAVSLITGTMSGIAGNTSGVVAGISGVAGAATNFHPNVVHSGSVAGTAGMLAVQKPYLIVTVPHICAPARQNYYKGYPGLVTVPLGTLSGFTVVESIHLDLMPGTEEEKREMMELLTGGVIL